VRFRAYILKPDRSDRWGADLDLDRPPVEDQIISLPDMRRVRVTHLLGEMSGYDGSFAADELPHGSH